MDASDLRRLAFGMVIAIWREKLRRITHDEKLTQIELERRANLPTGSVGRFEAGKNLPDPEELRRIAQALQTEPAELLREADLMFDLLARALGPLRLAREPRIEPPRSDLADAEIPVRLPEELQRRWETLVAAETDLAQERYRLEYLTHVHASRMAATLGPL